MPSPTPGGGQPRGRAHPKACGQGGSCPAATGHAGQISENGTAQRLSLCAVCLSPASCPPRFSRAPRTSCISRRFFRGAPTTDWDAIYTYEDFLCSACDFLCLCVDAYYFELYMKDEEEIREVLHQLGSLSGAQVALKTDETDGRYRMTID